MTTPLSPTEIDARLARTRLLVLDVDGVLTDGRVTYVGEHEQQSFHVHDGAAFAWLREAGVKAAIITGRGCAATEKRARELGVTELHLRARPKDAVLRGVQERLRIGPAETVAMGDDLHDFDLAMHAAVFACPAEARPEVRERADVVCAAGGGRGAVRELAERILAAKGCWDDRVAAFGRGTA